MFQKFLIDNAIKIISTIITLLVGGGLFIGKQQSTISYLQEKVSQQEIIIKNNDKTLIILDWYVKNHSPRIDRLEDIEKKK